MRTFLPALIVFLCSLAAFIFVPVLTTGSEAVASAILRDGDSTDLNICVWFAHAKIDLAVLRHSQCVDGAQTQADLDACMAILVADLDRIQVELKECLGNTN